MVRSYDVGTYTFTQNLPYNVSQKDVHMTEYVQYFKLKENHAFEFEFNKQISIEYKLRINFVINLSLIFDDLNEERIFLG